MIVCELDFKDCSFAFVSFSEVIKEVLCPICFFFIFMFLLFRTTFSITSAIISISNPCGRLVHTVVQDFIEFDHSLPGTSELH